MPQLSLYIDDSTMDTLRASAQSEGVSMSKYAAGLIRKRAQFGGWPDGYWESVYGALDDETYNIEADDDVIDASLDDACDWFEACDVSH